MNSRLIRDGDFICCTMTVTLRTGPRGKVAREGNRLSYETGLRKWTRPFDPRETTRCYAIVSFCFSSVFGGGSSPVLTQFSNARRQIFAIGTPVLAAWILAATCNSFVSHTFNRVWLFCWLIDAPLLCIDSNLSRLYHGPGLRVKPTIHRKQYMGTVNVLLKLETQTACENVGVTIGSLWVQLRRVFSLGYYAFLASVFGRVVAV